MQSVRIHCRVNAQWRGGNRLEVFCIIQAQAIPAVFSDEGRQYFGNILGGEQICG
ncbi:hypothetical protein J2S04_001820 [Alicyclobacillus tengchongensis]|uniref:Uncharacterized protein n=2 Tax=Alicyclobacillus tolerans TaxID=90970 RepID=A0A1M6RM00_9BACL|nr:hypothetical protein [Alicyclobacillus tengchongensis]SHK33493.1 hypothetical protein SAMN05443507_11251 [Alicyclobacillus montanus]